MEIVQALKIADTLISIAKPIIEQVAPKLQESMKDFAERMLVLSEKYPSLEEFAQVVDRAADIMGDVLFALGIVADTADTMGLKISQADKSIDEFDSVEAYINYLKDEIELDKEKYDSLTVEEKMAYSITGMAVESAAIGEKIGVLVPADIVELVAKVADIGKIAVEAKEIVVLLSKLKDEGIEDLNDVCDCIMGKGDSDRLKTWEVLSKVLDAIHPNDGNNIINEIVDEVRK